MTIKTLRNNENGFEGFSIEIEAGILGTFFLLGGIQTEVEEEERDGRSYDITYGASQPILRNGEYFLPWHIAAAMTENGNLEWSWLGKKEKEEIVNELLKIRHIYLTKGVNKAIQYVNRLCNTCVY